MTAFPKKRRNRTLIAAVMGVLVLVAAPLLGYVGPSARFATITASTPVPALLRRRSSATAIRQRLASSASTALPTQTWT